MFVRHMQPTNDSYIKATNPCIFVNSISFTIAITDSSLLTKEAKYVFVNRYYTMKLMGTWNRHCIFETLFQLGRIFIMMGNLCIMEDT